MDGGPPFLYYVEKIYKKGEVKERRGLWVYNSNTFDYRWFGIITRGKKVGVGIEPLNLYILQ
jgi:hypothetical protein